MEECKVCNLYNLKETIAKELLEKVEYPWEVLPQIHDYILEIGEKLDLKKYDNVGEGAVVGNSTELKNVILFNQALVPHFNYVGDSIIGYKAHMGAGSITSNVKSDKTLVIVKNGKEQMETGIKKFGAMLGDEVEVGCGTVLNPGTVIGKNSNIYPLSSVRGVVAEKSIYKNQNEIIEKY